jgi:uracil-DNA glycosylase
MIQQPLKLFDCCNECVKCLNLVNSRTQIVKPTVANIGGLLVIGEAPGRDEDLIGDGFVGAAGKTLDRLLSIHNITRDKYSRTNICRCRPPENRRPNQSEIDNCLPYLAELIQSIKPKVILTVGMTPTKVFFGTGNLYDKVMLGRENNNFTAMYNCNKSSHEVIKPVLQHIDYIVPTPHTSPLAFNRNAPSGEKWSQIATEQIEIAAKLLAK